MPQANQTAVFVEVLGSERLAKKLAELPTKAQNAAIRPAARAAAKVVRDRIRSLTPEDEGDLLRSVKVRAARRSRLFKGVRLLVISSAADPAFKGEDFHGAFIEFGVRDKEGQPRIAPQGFFSRGAKEATPQAKAVFRSELSTRLNALIAAEGRSGA